MRRIRRERRAKGRAKRRDARVKIKTTFGRDILHSFTPFPRRRPDAAADAASRFGARRHRRPSRRATPSLGVVSSGPVLRAASFVRRGLGAVSRVARPSRRPGQRGRLLLDDDALKPPRRDPHARDFKLRRSAFGATRGASRAMSDGGRAGGVGVARGSLRRARGRGGGRLGGDRVGGFGGVGARLSEAAFRSRGRRRTRGRGSGAPRGIGGNRDGEFGAALARGRLEGGLAFLVVLRVAARRGDLGFPPLDDPVEVAVRASDRPESSRRVFLAPLREPCREAAVRFPRRHLRRWQAHGSPGGGVGGGGGAVPGGGARDARIGRRETLDRERRRRRRRRSEPRGERDARGDDVRGARSARRRG